MNSIFQAFYKHNPNFIKHMTATSFIQILLVSFQVASAFVMVGIIGMVADREQREQIWLLPVSLESYLPVWMVFIGNGRQTGRKIIWLRQEKRTWMPCFMGSIQR